VSQKKKKKKKKGKEKKPHGSMEGGRNAGKGFW
jgi:hypothetical protein